MAIGQFSIMVPYGLSLAAVSMIGHSLGAYEADDARVNSRVIILASSICCSIVVIVLYFCQTPIISLFTDDTTVIAIAEDSFPVFVVAFAFAWMQCCASGIIKGAGYQGLGSLFGLASLTMVAIPVSTTLAFKQDMGISGLWIGYGLSALVLALAYYYTILCYIDWEAVATWAATSEEDSCDEKVNNSVKVGKQD